jgi:hypothetical protein
MAMMAPYLAVKKARIARAGKQLYTDMDVARRNLKPKQQKSLYVEYRPPEVLLKHLNDFNYLKFTNNHPTVALTDDNWREHTVGVVGGNAAVEVTDDGEIFVTNDVVFYDKKAYEDYQAGQVELSVGYESVAAPVENADAVGYDFVMLDITNIEHAALCDRARAGRNARILDSLDIDKLFGGNGTMGKKGSPLAFLRSKTKDSDVALSKAVFDSLEKFDKLGAEDQQKEIVGVISRVSPLGDGDDKDYLVAAITDSFKNSAGALERKDEVGKIIDGLYAKCKEADEKAAQAVVDSILGKKDDEEEEKKKKEEEEKKKEGDKKDKPTTDAASVEDIVAKALSGVTDSVVAGIKDSLPAMVEKTVKDALGLKGDGDDGSGSRVDDSLDEELDPSFLLEGVFGSN